MQQKLKTDYFAEHNKQPRTGQEALRDATGQFFAIHKLQLQKLNDDVPSYRMCPSKAPMYEQNLNAAGKCNNCFDSLCSGVVVVTCGRACGCNWTICVKCMNDWVENGFESDSHEDASDSYEDAVFACSGGCQVC